ncbi:TPA: hypothetical protein ACPZXT_005117 [Citrobacter freundii]|nr:hypothetical protein [Citrobacter freundii]
MMGNINYEKIARLNLLLPELVRRDININKNIYLLTSHSDAQYEEQIEPYLHLFLKYKNFNLFYANSLLVTEHNQVTSYHVPLILAICYSLSQGATPQYGCCYLEGDRKLGVSNKDNNPIAVLKKYHYLTILFSLRVYQ